MPNTLAHLGVQLLATRAIAGRRWAADVLLLSVIACVLPDVPWIVQRALRPFLITLDDPQLLFDARLYFTAQGSLLFCLILAAAIAVLVERIGFSFTVLAVGILAHLALDALQIKWANGVILWAPFSWRQGRVDWFWPESLWSDVMTASGVAVVVWFGARLGAARIPSGPAVQLRPSTGRVLGAALLLGLYLAAPLALEGQLQAANVHFIDTMRSPNRTGAVVELSQAAHGRDEAGAWVRTLSEEIVRLDCSRGEPDVCRAVEWGEGGRLSVRGRFVDHATVAPLALHQHRPRLRVVASLVGLSAALILAVLCIRQLRRKIV